MLISLLAGMAIVVMGENPRHLGDDVIMIVVHAEVNPFVFLRTSVDDIIVVLFRDDIDLILRQVHLEQFGLLNPTRTERHARILVKFLCQTHLHWHLERLLPLPPIGILT